MRLQVLRNPTTASDCAYCGRHSLVAPNEPGKRLILQRQTQNPRRWPTACFRANASNAHLRIDVDVEVVNHPAQHRTPLHAMLRTTSARQRCAAFLLQNSHTPTYSVTDGTLRASDSSAVRCRALAAHRCEPPPPGSEPRSESHGRMPTAAPCSRAARPHHTQQSDDIASHNMQARCGTIRTLSRSDRASQPISDTSHRTRLTAISSALHAVNSAVRPCCNATT